MKGGILETFEVVETLSLTQKYHKVKGMFGSLPILFVFDYLTYDIKTLNLMLIVVSLVFHVYKLYIRLVLLRGLMISIFKL